MPTHERIYTWEELAGKTIERAVRVSDMTACLVFTSGEFAWIRIDTGYEAGDEELRLDEKIDVDYLIGCGLATAEERAAREAEIRQYNRDSQARKRAQYEQLKTEFEGK